MEQKSLKWIILFLLIIYFLISDINIINQIELLVVLKVKDNQHNK
jgi:hypothetical protein